MKRETLKALGLEDSVIDQIMAENGKDIEKHKADAETTKATLGQLQAQLTEANKAIEGFKAMDIDGIKKAADDYKAKAEKAETDRTAEIARLQFDYALDGALTGAKAKNTKAVKALLNMDGLKLNGEEIVGLNEQIEKLKADNDYMFESEAQKPAIFAGKTDTPPAAPLNSAFFNFTGVRSKPTEK